MSNLTTTGTSGISFAQKQKTFLFLVSLLIKSFPFAEAAAAASRRKFVHLSQVDDILLILGSSNGLVIGLAVRNRGHDVVNASGHEDGKGAFHQPHGALNGKVEFTDPSRMVLDPVNELKHSLRHSARDLSRKMPNPTWLKTEAFSDASNEEDI